MYFLELLNGSNSLFLDRFAVAFTTGYTWIPFYVSLAVLVVRNNKTMGQIMLVFGCVLLGVLASGLLSDYIVKPYFMRPRPCYDPATRHLVHTVAGYSASGATAKADSCAMKRLWIPSDARPFQLQTPTSCGRCWNPEPIRRKTTCITASPMRSTRR